jgi:Protein of unknown function (DUF4239)
MLSYVESSFAVVLALAASLFTVAMLNRLWPIPSRKLINDVTGWQLGILGTTYGVILGFMLYTVWTDFRAADVDANLEASSVLNVYRIAAGLPSPEGETMQKLAAKYVHAAVDHEWPAMQRQEDNHESALVIGEMWQVLASAEAKGDVSSSRVDHLTGALSNLAERRNLREQERAIRLPSVLWLLLLAGGVATVGSACLLGNDNKWLHYCQVLALTFVVAVTLAAIADLARPFEGAISVSSVALQQAADMMQNGAAH